ncbi:MAG: hypothetical protein AB1480_05825 [Nitrospirota bacterium]
MEKRKSKSKSKVTTYPESPTNPIIERSEEDRNANLKIDAIVATIAELNPETDFTTEGVPKVETIEQHLDLQVSIKERDLAWQRYKGQQEIYPPVGITETGVEPRPVSSDTSQLPLQKIKNGMKPMLSIEKSPGDIEYDAEVFWDRLIYKNQICTPLKLSYKPSFDYDPANYKKFIIDLIKNKQISFCIDYENEIKPQLNWQQIMSCFSELKTIDQITIDFIIFALLKPFPFTNEFTHGYSELESLVQSKCAEINMVIKRFAPLANQLNNIQFPDLDLLPKIGFDHVQYNYYLRLCHEIVKIGKKIPDMHFRYFGIEKSKYKSPQKHTFWKYAVSGAVHEINQYCHDDNCDKKCNVFHLQAFRVVARLLKILYPSIWRENLDTITKRIKTKYYTFILS